MELGEYGLSVLWVIIGEQLYLYDEDVFGSVGHYGFKHFIFLEVELRLEDHGGYCLAALVALVLFLKAVDAPGSIILQLLQETLALRTLAGVISGLPTVHIHSRADPPALGSLYLVPRRALCRGWSAVLISLSRAAAPAGDVAEAASVILLFPPVVTRT